MPFTRGLHRPGFKARGTGDLDSGGLGLDGGQRRARHGVRLITAALFFPLAHAPDSALFVAIKSWFDFLFAAGNVPYGPGFIAVLYADLGRASRCCRGRDRMSESLLEPRRRLAGSDLR